MEQSNTSVSPVIYNHVAGNTQMEGSSDELAAYNFLNNIFNTANQSFESHRKTEGWISDVVNYYRESFNKAGTRSEVSSALKDTREDLRQLEDVLYGRIEYTDGTPVDFADMFRQTRGVKYSPEKIQQCQRASEEYMRADMIISGLNKLKTQLDIGSTSTASNANRVKYFNNAVLKTFNAMGVTDYDEINKILSEISEECKNNPELQHYGGGFRLEALGTDNQKLYGTKYAIMCTIPSGPNKGSLGHISEAKQAAVLCDALRERLTKVQAELMGLPENTTESDLDKTLNQLHNKYLSSFREAYGTKELSSLSERYISAQQQGVAYVDMGVSIGAMALAAFTGGATAAIATIVAITQPTQLLERATDSDGLTSEELYNHGKLLLEQIQWMAVGFGVGKIGDMARSLVKVKGLSSLATKSGQSLDDFVKSASVAGKLDAATTKALSQTRLLAETAGVSTEFAVDMMTTLAFRGEASTEDWVTSFVGALAGSAVNKRLSNMKSSEARVQHLQETFKDFKLTEYEANKILQALDKLNLEKQLPFGEIPDNVPQIVIPKKTTTDLYPSSDAADLSAMKSMLKSQAKGLEFIELEEMTAAPYKAQKEVKKVKEEFCSDKEAENLPIGAEYTLLKTFNDGNYQIYKATQSGSNPGFWVEHVNSGDLYYFKTANGLQNITEHVSSQLYKAAGIDTPDMNLVAAPGFNSCVSTDNCWIKSKAVAGLKSISENPNAAYEGFAVDAWLANRDAVCSGNTMLKGNTAVRLDLGGTLDFRARGERKNFGNVATELSTLLDPNINPVSADIFKNMTRDDLINSLKRVQSVTDNDIQKIYSSVKIYMNPEVFTSLKNRKDYLAMILREAENIDMKSEQSILDYVKTLESCVAEKYSRQINRMNDESAQLTRVMNDMVQQRETLCSDDELKILYHEYKCTSTTANSCINYGWLDDPMIARLDKAMDKCKLSEPLTLFRGDHFILDRKVNARYREQFPEYQNGSCVKRNPEYDDFDSPFMYTNYDTQAKQLGLSMDEILNRIYKKGTIVEEKQFVSTTISPVVAKEFGRDETDIIYRYRAPKGINATCLENFTQEIIGEQLNNAGGYLTGKLEGSEAEILLKRGFRYRMDNLTKENGKYIIDCTILPD